MGTKSPSFQYFCFSECIDYRFLAENQTSGFTIVVEIYRHKEHMYIITKHYEVEEDMSDDLIYLHQLSRITSCAAGHKYLIFIHLSKFL